ncbi:hypothetical protein [Demequina oxidasica]|uniref:hypothetical protein n=1 Tax=Demequina oxidasica TaxID=676199 RepID=UPI000783095D|nr:hypothetical protein [Demequina oxidasica]
MAEVTRATPRQLLRRVGVTGLITGPVLVFVGLTGAALVAGTNADSTVSAPSPVYGVVFFMVIAAHGLIELAAGAVALFAVTKLPDTSRPYGVNDFLSFAAVVVTFLGAVFQVVLNEPLVAMLVVAMAAIVLLTTSATRKAMRAAAEGVEAP